MYVYFKDSVGGIQYLPKPKTFWSLDNSSTLRQRDVQQLYNNMQIIHQQNQIMELGKGKKAARQYYNR